MDPRTRSVMRSIVFNVCVPLVLVLVAGLVMSLVNKSFDEASAFFVCEGVGTILRAFMPDVFGPRNPTY